MERLFHEKKTMDIVSRMPLIALEMNYTYDPTYLNYHNNICPRCQKEMVVKNKTVRGVGTTGMGVAPLTEYIYPYVLCKPCTNEMSKETKQQQEQTAIAIENYVCSVLPYLNEQ